MPDDKEIEENKQNLMSSYLEDRFLSFIEFNFQDFEITNSLLLEVDEF